MPEIHTRHLRRFCFSVLLAGSCISGLGAVELHNWRMPYYQIASEMELTSSSPSGMFWDDLGAAGLFDPAMLPDTGALHQNHWTLEPSYSLGAQDPAPSARTPAFWQLEVLNDIRYRNLLLRQTLAADRRYDYDPLYLASTDRFARGRIEEAYLQLDWRYGFLRFGRMLRNWGPFVDRSLILSSNPFSYDALEWQVHSSWFEFRHMLAAFEQNDHGVFAGTSDNLSGRFLAAHALNVMFKQWVTLGIVETELFHRASGFPDFQYMNPISIYSVTNTNQEGGQGNLMLGFQWNVHPGLENLSLRGQLLLDDFQVDHKITTDKEPSHWGLDAGIYWRDALPIAQHNLFKLGYQRRSEWVYTVSDNDMNDGQGYTYLSKSLGAPNNDGDSTWLGFSIVGKNFWAATAVLSYGRQGANGVTSSWKDSDSGNIPGLPFDWKLSQFPSGIVAKTLSVSLEGAAYLKDYADLRFGINNRWIRNKDNVPSANLVYSPVISAQIGLHFSDFWVRLPK